MKHEEQHIKNCIRYEHLNDHIIASLYEDAIKSEGLESIRDLMLNTDQGFFWDCIYDEKNFPETFEIYIRNIYSFREKYYDELYELLKQEIRDNE